MKCINKCLLMLFVISILISGCGSKDYDMPFDPDTTISALDFDAGSNELTLDGFASFICVAGEDIIPSIEIAPTASAEALFDVNSKQTLLCKNANQRLAPASLTKIMTALIALKYGHLDDVLTASPNVIIRENGAQTMGLKEGDRISLNNALHALLLSSANDCGVLIAEYIAGTSEDFAELMNKTALEIGATNTHFVNPHGLSAEDHYTTAYDLYLIFNEALKYDQFLSIINKPEYTCMYQNRDGKEKKYECISTNGYFTGGYASPDNITVIGGKTGTTNAAGSCLILLVADSNNESYISIILNDADKDTLYMDMTNILYQIQN